MLYIVAKNALTQSQRMLYTVACNGCVKGCPPQPPRCLKPRCLWILRVPRFLRVFVCFPRILLVTFLIALVLTKIENNVFKGFIYYL
jgi:hypothetical protein